VSQALARYAAVVVGVVVVGGLLMSLIFHGPGDSSAIWTSGAVAVALQLAAFAVGRVAGRAGLMARMGAGALVRFFGLVIYALVALLALKLPAVAALVSLATFLFLSALLDPLLIKS
jgi:hypothetical protein